MRKRNLRGDKMQLNQLNAMRKGWNDEIRQKYEKLVEQKRNKKLTIDGKDFRDQKTEVLDSVCMELQKEIFRRLVG
jgi:thymidylate kinase